MIKMEDRMGEEELLGFLKEMCPSDSRIPKLEAKLKKPKKQKAVLETLEE